MDRKDRYCSICHIEFSIWGVRKLVCGFCFRPVCCRCSMHKAYNSESRMIKRKCDTCHSEFIKESVVTQHRIELERLKFEISNLQKRLDSESITIEKERKSIEELNSIIEETKEEFTSREHEMQEEIKNLEQELEKVNSEYKELLSRMEFLTVQNHKLDVKIHNLIEQNEDFSIRPIGQVYEKILHIKKDIKDLNLKLQSNCIKSPLKKDNSVARIKEEISNLRNEKNRIINKITEFKEVESIKESNISMLLTTLSNNSTAPDLNIIYKSFEDEELFRQQQDQIEELRLKIARKIRRNEFENKRCMCEIV
ncbi:hypothetical protein SteCoe_24600 [Stentor coeruleus]|uniref:FYVE-type domain-containing protein n=1 Tax=Stentor coeruleus TaxID=5963 RepID=A0A1R2BH36_9CILI|nr:hypothetical protein SteCoe_24600 [Stentor coeruleus]